MPGTRLAQANFDTLERVNASYISESDRQRHDDMVWRIKLGQQWNANMQHGLGDYPIKFLSKKIPTHSPLRPHYHFGNALLLYKEPCVPLNWKLVDAWRLCLKYVFYSLFAPPRRVLWRMMTAGVRHELVGKSGKLGGATS